MSDKFTARQRRSRKLRSKTKEMSNHRLSIFRSNNQIYAQVFSPDGKEVLAHASSADKEVIASIHIKNIDINLYIYMNDRFSFISLLNDARK